jgi:hypothetical protein
MRQALKWGLERGGDRKTSFIARISMKSVGRSGTLKSDFLGPLI